jgi:hypothetical protein
MGAGRQSRVVSPAVVVVVVMLGSMMVERRRSTRKIVLPTARTIARLMIGISYYPFHVLVLNVKFQLRFRVVVAVQG